MPAPSTYDSQRVLVRSILLRDIAEPLLSFDAGTPAGAARSAMQARGADVAGVRENGTVAGYVTRDALADGPCGQFAASFDGATILPDAAPLNEVVRALHQAPRVFVSWLGVVGGVATRNDLQDPPARMWLFGMITIIELNLLALIERGFSDESWSRYLSAARLAKAQELLAERQRRGQNPRLLDCLQFSDKAQIAVRDEALRQRAGFASRRRGDETIKHLEALRNNLAHAQDIVSFDWDMIVTLADNLDRVASLGQPRSSP
jgi:hypothetical protein